MSEAFTLPVPFTIRPCAAEDLPALEWFGLFRCHREIIAATWARSCEGQNAMLVADVNGFPAAQAWLDLAKHAPHPTGVIWAVRVLPCLQGLGIGSRMMSAAETELRRHGFRIAELGVEKHNHGARRLYERLGYRPAGEVREESRYRTPEGQTICDVFDQWILQKQLGP